MPVSILSAQMTHMVQSADVYSGSRHSSSAAGLLLHVGTGSKKYSCRVHQALGTCQEENSKGLNR